MAQLVACYLGVVEAARSSRVTQTKEKPRSFGRIPETAWFCFVVLFFIEIDCQVKYNTIILCSCALGVKFYYAGSNLIKRNFSADKPLKKLLTDITEVQCADGSSMYPRFWVLVYQKKQQNQRVRKSPQMV